MEIIDIISIIIAISVMLGIVLYMVHMSKTWPNFKIYLSIGGLFIGPSLIMMSAFADAPSKEMMETAYFMQGTGYFILIISIATIMTRVAKMIFKK